MQSDYVNVKAGLCISCSQATKSDSHDEAHIMPNDRPNT